MSGWQTVAREGRPAPLTAEQADAIRQSAIAAAREAAKRPVARRAPVMIIGGMLMSAVTAGILIARAQPDTPMIPVPPASEFSSPAVVKQLQFSTPGGTRIIWQFDPNFTLRETLP